MRSNILRYLTIFCIVLVQLTQSLPADEIIRNEALKEIRQYMNETIDPCENFYEFACGNWAKYHTVSKDEPTRNIFSNIEKAFDQKLQELLATDDPGDTSIETKVKYQYRACLKLPKMWSTYLQKLKDIIKEFGQMPALVGDNWEENNFDWQQTVARIQHRYGVGSIVLSAPLHDLLNNSQQAIYIDRLPFYLGAKSVYNDEPHEASRIQYKNKIAKTLQDYLGISANVAEQTAEDMFQFERALVQGLPDDNKALDVLDMYHRVTLDEMQSSYSPTLDMKTFINTSWGSVPDFPYYENRMYLQNLVEVMPKTPKKTVANYIFYALLDKFVFPKPDNETKHKEKCITNVKEVFSNVLENIFYRKYGTKETKKVFDEMWHSLKMAFEDVLNGPNLDWLGADSRLQAMEKLNAMNIEIPASKQDEHFNFIRQVTMDKDDYLENLKQIAIASYRDDVANLYKPPKLPYMGSMLSFTPVNVLSQNKITVPVAILQPYFLLSASLPNAYNYGRLATTLGHELIHGYDDSGRLLDKHGNFRQWFDADTSNAFQDRVKCFVDQYQQYKFGGQHLPKRDKQAENIADNSGTRVAYLAYLKWYENNVRSAKEQALEIFPELGYNHKQLFFISYTQMWCTKTPDDEKLQILASDMHTPSELRPAAALSNMEEFSKEFKCPPGSAMNPKKKCQLY